MESVLGFIKDFIVQFVAPVAGTALAWLLAKAIYYLTQLAKKGISSIDNTMVQTFVKYAAKEVVAYVEQKYNDLKGTEKYLKALEELEDKVDDFTERVGLGRDVISDKDLEVAIEAAVKELTAQWEMLGKPPFGGKQ